MSAGEDRLPSEGISPKGESVLEWKPKIVWKNAIGFLFLHLLCLYGCFLMATQAKVKTMFWCLFVAFAAGEGVTIGAHRLWSHRAFKATLPFRLILLVLQTIAGQNCMYIWVRDHRQHHKYSDTDADPHNSKRGFFFSHIGWLMMKKHPDVISKGKNIDLSDLEADPWVMFQKKYYKPLYIIFAVIFPVIIPVLCWGEDWWVSFFVSYFSRYILGINMTWMVNSWAHKYGTKPYTKTIPPTDSHLVSLIALGEGWHNYHHTFPWDYKAAEYGYYINTTTFLIDLAAKIGWAYDRKSATPNMIKHRIFKQGDGTHMLSKFQNDDDDFGGNQQTSTEHLISNEDSKDI